MKTNSRSAAATADAPGREDVSSKYHGLSAQELVRIYRTMLLSRRIDDKEIQLKNQSQIFFQISGAGHEAVLVAAGLAMKPGYDWFYPYYRDRALCLTLGMTPLEMLLSAVGAKDDPNSGGRQMPSHWGHKQLNIVSQSSPTGTQCLQALGCAEAALLYDRIDGIADAASRYEKDEVAYVSLGDGTTSEGEFWESLTTSCVRQAPVVFHIEDNGYAISVPVEVQTPGGSLSALIESWPNLHVIRVDGTDPLASYAAFTDAVAWARARKGPALVHSKVIRPYSHSLSDDEKLYKTPEEREEEATRDPIPRFARFLIDEKVLTQADLDQIAKDIDAELAEATDKALAAAKPPRDTAELYVYTPTD